MLCHKCRTAMDDKTPVCKYCGTLNHKMFTKAATLSAFVFLSVAFASVAVLTHKPSANNVITDENVYVEIVPPDFYEDEAVNIIEDNEWKPQFFLEENLDDIKSMIKNVATVADIHKDTNSVTTTFISNNGYLYDYNKKAYVSINEYFSSQKALNVSEFLENKYLDYKLLLLYLKPSDLAQFRSLNIKSGDDDELQVFVACETKEGFVIVSDQSPGGIIAREDLKSLLDSYNTKHGDVVRPKSENPEYVAIKNAVKKFAKLDGDIDIRYMSADEKYSMVVISPKNNSSLLKGYVLAKNNGTWSVTVSNFETMDRYIQSVKAHLPDFNTDLAPRYNLHYELRQVKSDIDVNSLLSDESPEVSFVCGSRNYVYIELEDGQGLLGYKNNTFWHIYRIDNFLEGEAIMNSLSDTYSPYYIFKQE